MDKYKLHSHGDNWFHFRKNMDSAMESFSVTYCHDGTVCMTGDYGCLCWQREFFPKRLDYGFPGKDTWIGYFAEKIVRAEQDQKIHTWKKDLAIKDIEQSIKEREEEEIRAAVDQKEIEALESALDALDCTEDGDYGYNQMLEIFSGRGIELEDYSKYGRCYTDAFTFKFERLVSVSDTIIEAIKQKKQMPPAEYYIYLRKQARLLPEEQAWKEGYDKYHKKLGDQ